MKKNNLVSVVILGILFSILSCTKDRKDVPEAIEKTYIILSDIHLGDKRSVDEQYCWNLHMKDTLISFLDYLSTNSEWDELIIAGDMIDEWVCPKEYYTFADEAGKAISESEFFGKVVENNRDVFDKFIQLKNEGHKLVYIPGNHDMQTTSEDFDKYLPGVFDQARTIGVDGMGEYMPDDEIYIEHGHRYDITNAPYIGKVGVDNIPQGSILPSGFFVSRIYTDLTDRQSFFTKALLDGGLDDKIYDIYWSAFSLLCKDDSVVTMTDGMTRTYGFNDFAYSSSKLFNNIDKYMEPNDGWKIRCSRNNAFFMPSVTESMLSTFIYRYYDKMGLNILENTEAAFHILVWGHSHDPEFIVSKQSALEKVIYVNTGCWIDSENASGSENTATYAVIQKGKLNEYNVSLRQFKIDEKGEADVQIIDSTTYWGINK